MRKNTRFLPQLTHLYQIQRSVPQGTLFVLPFRDAWSWVASVKSWNNLLFRFYSADFPGIKRGQAADSERELVRWYSSTIEYARFFFRGRADFVELNFSNHSDVEQTLRNLCRQDNLSVGMSNRNWYSHSEDAKAYTKHRNLSKFGESCRRMSAQPWMCPYWGRTGPAHPMPNATRRGHPMPNRTRRAHPTTNRTRRRTSGVGVGRPMKVNVSMPQQCKDVKPWMCVKKLQAGKCGTVKSGCDRTCGKCRVPSGIKTEGLLSQHRRRRPPSTPQHPPPPPRPSPRLRSPPLPQCKDMRGKETCALKLQRRRCEVLSGCDQTCGKCGASNRTRA
eukprot:2381604-Prymnesium_polylepis.1